VGQHDAAAADPNPGSGGGDGSDERFGAVAGEAARSVMLGDPVARVTELVGQTGEVNGIAEGIAGGSPSGIGD